ncbi:uncharacterized protein LOC121377029 [Gigantopelta aegis]|uniref:uncharacterized protein LOC121377029 n=1 Tax=Gigantopelta aegis TaxID=1735272 RepID=UPI001B88A390|nr:uncharacterized protein LOC121377029 [Gigantopelta aegis]
MKHFKHKLGRVETMMKVTGKRAVNNIKEAQTRQKRNYDQRHTNQENLPVGTKVLKKTLRRQDRKGGKGEKLWIGPYVIRGVTKSGSYLLSITDGIIFKSAINGANLKVWTDVPAAKTRKTE